MAAPDATALQRSDLNPFLFADIGMEANGMPLSVLSAFARRGADPWTEAGRLASLSKTDAADSLANMIASMPRSLWPFPDAIVISGRLIGLLPARPVVGLPRMTQRIPLNLIALVAAGAALLVAFAVMMLQQ